MKKLIALLCMITCIFGLAACNTDVSGDEAKTPNQETAELLTTEVILPYMNDNFQDKAYTDNYVAEYNVHEIEALMSKALTAEAHKQSGLKELEVDVVGNAMLAGIISFQDTFSVIGRIEKVESITSAVEGKEISVEAVVTGETGEEATAELIFADDIFLTLESVALNQNQTFGELMTKAVYDTLMGMGTVFVVLILICFIISGFKIINKLQNKAVSKTAKADVKSEAVDNTIAQIIEKEELSDDTELVAVIAAAIAASEGRTSTDGFVVRSIRRANKSRRQNAWQNA